jgi:hypothetical protein
MDYLRLLRKLAKSHSWQVLFSNAKETNLPLFPYDGDYIQIQVLFLYYLSFYSSLQEAISLKETTDLVYENEIYEDSFMYYRSLKYKDDNKNSFQNKVQSSSNLGLGKTQWIFKKKT